MRRRRRRRLRRGLRRRHRRGGGDHDGRRRRRQGARQLGALAAGAAVRTLRAASAKWHSDVEEAPSPFRAENFDLLQRACTREAALSVLARLDAAADRDPRSVEAASAEWLRSKLADEWLPRFESPSRPQLAGLFCLSLLSAPPTPRRVGDSDSGGGDGDGGTLRLVDPEAIGQEVLEARVGIASAWAAALATSSVSDALQELLREDLEGQLASNTDPEATRDDSD